MQMAQYEAVLRRLVECGRGGSHKNMPSSFGLDRTRKVLTNVLGRDQVAKMGDSVIHVVGTNGKGSVAWKTSRTLLNQSLSSKVGLYTSPHLFTVRERIRVNGEMITESDFVRLGQEVLKASENEGSSYFELVTCMALAHFAQLNCDAIVLEAGMGGRGDATNVLESARVVALTSVAMDHMAVLGSSLEEICKEKIGVVKPRASVVIGPSVWEQLDPVIMSTCRTQGAQSVKRLLPTTSTQSFDEENTRIARACVEEFLSASPTSALTIDGTRPRCRMEIVEDTRTGKPVILDVGHNPAALARVMSQIQAQVPLAQGGLVFAIAADKEVGKCIEVLTSTVPSWRSMAFVRMPTDKGRKFADPGMIVQKFIRESSEPRTIMQYIDVRTAIERLLEDDDIEFVLVCGSHGLMADALITTGHRELFELDPFDSNERGAKET